VSIFYFLNFQNCLPSGGRGFVVAALLAAAMTTFDSTINRFARNDEEARHDNASVLATNRSE
jgi:hypothetical protein